MKLRCQIFGTRVLGTSGTLKFVPQPLTVLLSYSIVAYVPLFAALVERKMDLFAGNSIDLRGAMRCQALMHPGWDKR